MLLCKWEQNTNIWVLCPCAPITKTCIFFLSRVVAWLHLKWCFYAALILGRKGFAKREKGTEGWSSFILASPPPPPFSFHFNFASVVSQDTNISLNDYLWGNIQWLPPWLGEKSYLKMKYLEIIGMTDTQLNIHSLWLTGGVSWFQNFAEKRGRG